MMRRAAAAWRACRARHPTRLERHLRDDDDLIRGLRILAVARDPAIAEAMERRTRQDEPVQP